MNSSLERRVRSYLGFKGMESDPTTEKVIAECLAEVKEAGQFRYFYRIFDELPDFLRADPYAGFLSGCNKVILSITTLGAEVDRRVKVLSRTDLVKSLVFDACASAYLEELADDFEKGLGDDLTYRFCPGYGGSQMSDIRHIFTLVRPEKSGVTLTEEGYMLPLKSMAGIIGVGKKMHKNCGNCMMHSHCEYLKEGVTCWTE